jgi:hypothetical protein
LQALVSEGRGKANVEDRHVRSQADQSPIRAAGPVSTAAMTAWP